MQRAFDAALAAGADVVRCSPDSRRSFPLVPAHAAGVIAGARPGADNRAQLPEGTAAARVDPERGAADTSAASTAPAAGAAETRTAQAGAAQAGRNAAAGTATCATATANTAADGPARGASARGSAGD